MARKRKKSKYRFFIWLSVGIIAGLAIGFLMDNLAIGFGLGLAIGGFAGIISGVGR